MAAKHDDSASSRLLCDVSFYENFLVQNREVAIEKIKKLTGNELIFMCTNCTFDVLKKKNHERDLAGWMECYECLDCKPINEYRCLKSCVAQLPKGNNVILAIGDAHFYQQFKKITRVPMVHFKNGKLKFKEHAVYDAVTNESLPLKKRKRQNEGTSANSPHETSARMEQYTGVKVSFEGYPAKRKQNNTGASSKENDEERIAQSFQQMKKKICKSEKMLSKQAKANNPKISGNMQYFVDEHAYRPPFNVLFDSPFFQLYMLPNKDTVVDNIEELLGNKFVFCHTYCVLDKINQKRLLDLLVGLPCKEYRCKDVVGVVRKDFECLKAAILENGLNDSLVLATGDSNLHSLMRKLSPIPIIYLRDVDNLEACFEGQTASRGNIAVSKENQNVGTSASSETIGRNTGLVPKMGENIGVEVSFEGVPIGMIENTGVGVSFEDYLAKRKQNNTGASEKKICKQAKAKKQKKRDQELEDFFDAHYS